ncbi:MAG: tRNA (guanosine(46)-N7)-methyltransferase TrmB [Planctomycetaceae bacterium]|nr:tRNA (guanosine(46)-N7)-methyltransferase TrmB [Planctomycetaceae bacterium]
MILQTAPIKPIKPWFQVTDDLGDHLDWAEFFGNENPVEADIGCGRGLFLVSASDAHPNVNYVGLEIDYREGRRAAMRLKRRHSANARVIGGDCRVVLGKLMPRQSLQAAHVYFPDPWWKKRHHKRRLFTPEFADLLAESVQPAGHVHSWSDVVEYFEVIQSIMDQHPAFEKLEAPEERVPIHDMDYQTSFERKKRKLGLPIYRGLWQRKRQSD